MKKGLVLEGGAMRGMFTAGILDIFMEEDIDFEGCVGTSAGCIAACSYKSRQIGRTIRYNIKYADDYRYASIRNLIFTGEIYNKKFAYEKIPNVLDPFDTETFSKNPMEFYACATDVITGKAVYHKLESGDADDITWMRASCSMPLVSKVVKIDGFSLLDGGVADSIPLRFMEKMGYDKNVVILTQPADYTKEPNNLMPLVKVALRRYPNIVKAMANRHIMYNETLSYIHSRKKQGDVLVLQPKEPLNVGKIEHNPNKLKKVYETGRAYALERLDDIKSFLAD